MQDVAQLREILQRHGVQLEKWVISLPNGASWPVVKIPHAAECSVCGTVAKMPTSAGRVACEHCGALVLTISSR